MPATTGPVTKVGCKAALSLHGLQGQRWKTGREEQLVDSSILCSRLDRSVFTHQGMLQSHSLTYLIQHLFLK